MVNLAVYDLVGRKVKDLIPGSWMGEEGKMLMLNAEGMSSGTYMLRLEAGDSQQMKQIKQITLVK
jgi:hypothetical protein